VPKSRPSVRGAAPRERSLLSYLVLPRPKDAAKAVLLPLTFGLGLLSTGDPDKTALVRAVVVWCALELLVYQARYQWNDARGFAADQRHPDRAGRGRLPGPIGRARQHVGASGAVAVARLLATAGLVLLLPGLRLGWVLAAVTGAVFGVALLYEALRTRATGRTGAVPPPLRPALVGLWIVVGAGYAVRGLTGLAVAVDLTTRPLLAASATMMLWAFGVAYVTSAWALEATAFARFEGREVVWAAEAGQAREHLLALVRWLPSDVSREPGPADGAAREWPALRGSTRATAPWNLSLVVSAAAAGSTGRLLAGPGSATDAGLAAAVAAALAVGVLLVPRGREAAALVAAVALGGALAGTGSPRPVLGALPWLGVVGAHLLFTSKSLSTRGRRIADAAVRLGAGARVVGRTVVGPRTWQAIEASEARPDPEDRAG